MPIRTTTALDPVDAALVWFRRDLRLHDHAALYHALRHARRVWCVFIFDTTILDGLPPADRRVEFIHASVAELDRQLRARGGGLLVRHGDPRTEIPALASALRVQAVHAGRDHEPAAVARDAQVLGHLADLGILMHTHKDQVVFEASEVMTANDTPYGVFTPYKNAWLRRLTPFYLRAYPVERHAAALAAPPAALDRGVPSLNDLDFLPTGMAPRLHPGESGGEHLLLDFLERIDHYDQTRDFPAVKGPSYLSVHLRFGTVSIRQLARLAHERMQGGSRGAEVWLSELIWRDFYHQVLHHHPRIVDHSFRPEYDAIRWAHGKQADALFAAWCEGRTGYPLVDAAMHQLNQTGYMHNRLRMVVASFLTKDLGIDWRRGERYFALQLNDYDLAANNGGWQWAASTGCDAQPYFRIFNPVSQSEKFDAGGKFIRRYLPQLAGLSDRSIHAPWQASPLELVAAGIVLGRDYPHPVVDHAQAREATLERFAVVKSKAIARPA
ncbi:deoxyribodipyrimidine photo-lyase [Sphaerotilus hippei]|uniref:Deoxyribodipyrimidine photo-lyase n=1 Tax=Sphaerotilus hippei TaxID=744406 RepID=A0A318GW53_9BURK|nr:deoxyribodipyrimidine photo-lyase [Sphaerotilus hippei]PXW93851.1 deoxyribodipyrimidine photo-lyase [Sphaerotilus hippei]